MSTPINTLSDIVELAHQQDGIRFQLSTQQLVNFANMIQMIAYNQDICAFEEHDQILVLGQDVFLETDSTSYTAPSSTDIGQNVLNGAVIVGKLLNYGTKNRMHKWIIEPPDGGTNFTLTAGDVLTISGGTAATGVTCTGQSFYVSNGPYKVPSEAAGNPPFRKLVGLSKITDRELFQSRNRYQDYGLDNYSGGGLGADNRYQNYPYRFDVKNQEITLISETRPEILQTTELCGAGGTTLNTSSIRWDYYKNPYPITSITDESQLQLPEEYRYEILYSGITALADVAVYGEKFNRREIIEPMCQRFWEDMGSQYQQYGRNSDWISHGDTLDDYFNNDGNYDIW